MQKCAPWLQAVTSYTLSNSTYFTAHTTSKTCAFGPELLGLYIKNHARFTERIYPGDRRLWFWFIFHFSNIRKSSHKAPSSNPEQKRVLILGSGYVSLPVVEYLDKFDNTQVTVGKFVSLQIISMTLIGF